MAVFLAASKWAHLWSGLHIIVRSDNMAAVSAINKSTSRSAHLLPIVKELLWLTVKFNSKLLAVFLPGKLNVLADHISRILKQLRV